MDGVAAHLLAAADRADNPSRHRRRIRWGKQRGLMPSSTLSEHLGQLRLDTFGQSSNRSLLRLAIVMLGRLRPDGGEIIAALDEHLEPYHFDGNRRKSRRRGTGDRSNYMIRMYVKNKSAPYAHSWVAVSISWRHKGRKITFPVRVVPRIGLRSQPHVQVKEAIAAVRKLRWNVACLVVDRGYDSDKVRKVQHRYQFPVGVRLRSTPDRYVQLSSGRHESLKQLRRQTLEAGTPRTARDPVTGKIRVYHESSLKIRFQHLAGEFTLFISLQVEGHKGRWKVVGKRELMIAFPASIDAATARRFYRRRWDIEVMFYTWSHERPKTSAKTIQSHVVGMLVHVLKMTAGYLAWLLYLVTNPDGLRPSELRKASVVDACREIWRPFRPPD